ncbi:alpha-1,2-fucosyltransferase [Haloferula sp. A504]|uniref:alpha-1,2-fucosyltransferase n=1 Tax=Haloferula sp. A504 TaxID=3373601 RepID=UPI0031C651E5|nr:alpha-1,2-fucosyltransferase [Verrucomicrobiaceae bacterium E54]
MKPRLIAIIKGGLGNQLFGYAAARALARRDGRKLLIDDSSGFARDDYGRSFRLDRFPIEADPAPADARLGDPKGLRHRWTRSINKLLPPFWKDYVKEAPGRPPEQLTSFHSKRQTLHLNGYWQSEAYFADIANSLRRELQPPASGDDELERGLQTGDTVMLHIRRIRYAPRLDSGYYTRGIHAAAETLDSPRFEVFGDDLDWARERLEFGDHPVRFHDPADDELIDFRRMTLCRHAIVANSSFSWWAAWLQPPGGQVWTPDNPGWPLRPAAGWTTVANKLEYDA